MTTTNCRVFRNGRVLTPAGVQPGLAVTVRDGIIAEIGADGGSTTATDDVVDLDGKLLLPGFLDIQVNGGGGVLFNDDPSIDTVAAIARAHYPYGTTGLLPTLISDELDVVERALRVTEEAIDAGIRGVVGAHIEGPFLNPDRRGVHDGRRLRRLTAEMAESLEPVRNGKTLLTLAPEAIDPGLIRALTQRGFIVSAGHTNAGYDEITAALAQGVTGFTHLFNAMSQLTAREPGVVGAALDDPGSFAGVIADIHHVSPAAIRIALRCKGEDKIMLVTDAMPPAGSSLESFELLGKTVSVRGDVCVDQNGTLAGTALTMSAAVRNMMEIGRVDLAVAARMASRNPAMFLGMAAETGSIETGRRADLLVADDSLQIRSSWIAGANVYRRDAEARTL